MAATKLAHLSLHLSLKSLQQKSIIWSWVTIGQWLFLVPVKGGIGSIVHPPIGSKNTTYIPLIGLAFWGVICYLPPFLREPKTTIELGYQRTANNCHILLVTSGWLVEPPHLTNMRSRQIGAFPENRGDNKHGLKLLLMAEIQHQLIGSLSHYF